MPEPLILEASNDTPKVVFDKGGNLFELTGRSLPENAIEFYQPLFEWMDAYAMEPNPVTKLEVNMFYFNTSSSKMVLDLLFKLEEISNAGHKAEVIWYCDEDDDDMIEMGEEFADMVDIPLKIVYNE